VLAQAVGIFSAEGWNTLLRWAHILAGVTWIGLLYFFNLVQVPAYAAFGDEAKARNIAIDKVSRRALWWFRWAAISTFLLGVLLTTEKDFFSGDFGKSGPGLLISLGMLLGTIMMLNVWGVIWRNQKVVLANAANVLAGGEANPDAPAAGRRAVMASRQNFVFSFAMLFCMVFASHDAFTDPDAVALSSGKVGAFWGVTFIIIVVMELNALGLMPWKTAPNKGLNAMYDGKGTTNPLIAATGLLVVVAVLSQLVLR
jgi:uncharacterized membrane protein